MKKLLGIVVLGLFLITSSQAKEKAIYCNKVIKASDDRVFDMMKNIEITFFIDEKNKKIRMPNPNTSVNQDVYNVKFSPEKKQIFWQLVTLNPVTNEKLVNVHFYRTDLKQFATRVHKYESDINEENLRVWYTFQCY